MDFYRKILFVSAILIFSSVGRQAISQESGQYPELVRDERDLQNAVHRRNEILPALRISKRKQMALSYEVERLEKEVNSLEDMIAAWWGWVKKDSKSKRGDYYRGRIGEMTKERLVPLRTKLKQSKFDLGNEKMVLNDLQKKSAEAQSTILVITERVRLRKKALKGPTGSVEGANSVLSKLGNEEVLFRTMLRSIERMKDQNQINELEVKLMQNTVQQAINNSLLGEYLRRREANLLEQMCQNAEYCSRKEGINRINRNNIKKIINAVDRATSSKSGGDILQD